jgi:serine protease AprX
VASANKLPALTRALALPLANAKLAAGQTALATAQVALNKARTAAVTTQAQALAAQNALVDVQSAAGTTSQVTNARLREGRAARNLRKKFFATMGVRGMEAVTDGLEGAPASNEDAWGDAPASDGGAGVGVAIIDSGIESGVDFGDRITHFYDFTQGDIRAVTPNDGYGHGTHVAGLIAGDGTNRPTGDPLMGDYVGVAPDANLIAVKAADDQGNTSVLDVIDGLQFVVDHKADYNIRVVNLSLKSTQPESYLTDPLDAAVEAAWNSGIVVVTAAGNDGTAADAVSYAPANDPYVITVGGVDDMGTKNIDDDTLASWSSRGTTQDGFAKPDVLAPGAHLVSTIPPNADYPKLCPTCMVSGQYFQVGGTSMAAGVVSGGVANMIQAHPTWTPDQIKNQLVRKTTAVLSPKTATLVDATGQVTVQNLTRTVVGGEITMDKAINDAYDTKKPSLNAGLTPNSLLDPATGQVDYTRASWSRASWSAAGDLLRASWSQASWSRASWSRASWSASPEICADFERASWSRASWSRASWSRASWSRASWSADGMSSPDLTDVDYSSIDAQIAQAQADCASLLGQVDPTRASWSRASWSRASWSTSFNK